uniref:ATP synthase F0 subunit 6 n=1 Tax=Eisenia nordenskioldi TaxID=538895 RepID=UPI0021B5CBCE|nr:ATP synthase F0 subunit 6 [Eisenia nordenskioldi]UIX22958.1 ATP synthase F0 subunit 6 [Eisenia nordenskioldi]UIX22971.1 ATP synthase F0 subunit 6 [Eisenia nordenskioldi]
MMSDIFSSFDPFVYSTLFPSNSLFLVMNIVMILMIQSSFWVISSRSNTFKTPLNGTIFTQLTRTFSLHLKGLSSVLSSIFIMLIILNLMGLVPYTFSTSSHLIFTLTFGLPVWLSLIISSFSSSPKKTTAHFLPDGAPDWLNPFLVLIESTSVLVRPLTLSFRLAANMSAGHIVLSLVGIYCASAYFSNTPSTLILLVTSLGYILFEIAICLIQAYIFCLLLSLYSDDHAH